MSTPQSLAARYAALPESIRDKCPRPLVNVTPAQVKNWIADTRMACLDAAMSTIEFAATIAHTGDVDSAVELKDEAAEFLAFARDLGDLMGLPAAKPAA